MARIAVVQTDPVFGDQTGNIEQALSLMERENADLYILPELFNTGYNFIDRAEATALAEPVDGATARSLQKFAAARSAHIVYGFAEQDDQLYNSAALVGPAGCIGLYRKVHLFDREHLIFAPGNLGFPVFELPIGTIGLMICFDWIYPESARTLALKGAQLIAHPSNLVLPYCPDAMVTRCLENRVFSATANRVGTEERGDVALTYIGSSEIVTPGGEVLFRCSRSGPAITAAMCDLPAARKKSINRFDDLLAGRRVDQYS